MISLKKIIGQKITNLDIAYNYMGFNVVKS